jgi:hypothetical protein
LGLAGCGGKAATETTATDEPLATPEELLVGNWQGEVEVDQEAVAKKLEEAKDLDERAKNRIYWSIETPASLKSKLTLKADGSMKMAATISTAEGEKNIDGEGTWEVLSAGGDQATVRLSYEGQVEEKVFTFEDKDAFGTDPPGVDKTIGTLRFRRLR